MFFISLFPLLSFLNHWELLVSEFIIHNYLKLGNKTFQKLCLGLLWLYQQLQMQVGMKSEQRRIKRGPKEYFRMWSKGIDRGKSLWNVEAFSFLLLVCARKTLNSNCWRKNLHIKLENTAQLLHLCWMKTSKRLKQNNTEKLPCI